MTKQDVNVRPLKEMRVYSELIDVNKSLTRKKKEQITVNMG